MQPLSSKRRPFYLSLITVISIVISYYLVVLLHEWGHGAVAWMFGYKESPFAIQYGGWLLSQVSESVNYPAMLANGHHMTTALIGIAGITVNILLLITTFLLLRKPIIQRHHFSICFFYWFAILNMTPIFGYIPLATFSNRGDIGWFTQGLQISAWWIFIPGTSLVALALYRIFKYEIIKLYTLLPIKTLHMQRVNLIITFYFIFLFPYSYGRNPFSFSGKSVGVIILEWAAIALVPVLFLILNPSRNWIKKAINTHSSNTNIS